MVEQMVDMRVKRSLLSDKDPYEEEYTMKLHLNEKEIEKLNLASGQVGDKLDLSAKVKITSVNISDKGETDKRESMTLTFIEADVKKPDDGRGDNKAEKLFGAK